MVDIASGSYVESFALLDTVFHAVCVHNFLVVVAVIIVMDDTNSFNWPFRNEDLTPLSICISPSCRFSSSACFAVG